MIRKLLSVVLTAAMMSAIFGTDALVSVTALAANAAAEPEVTVVGKRITNDNTYFEISLEVNGDYEDYTSVGVVLKYDPSLIIPAESWDDGAAAADMTASTSWATRRALPTLGKDTWSSHTALTYIETDAGTGTSTGYLYLGAEYPGTLPATPMPTESADATDAPADEPTTAPASTPEATADPDADPHTNPVVVARFMYASDTAKDTIENTWTAAWDADWTQNTILTIADSAVAETSPAQYSFAYYYSDYSMKAYSDPVSAILDTSEQAAATDIEVVLGKGDSAKSSGLSLSDVSVVLFYDWDDSLLGSITLAKGTDSGEAVNDYIEEEFIHPDLQSNTNYESTARADNYRGEYPYDGPSSSNPTVPDGSANTRTDGGDYPLTNKLEYCFAGRSFYEGLPFIGGWTEVTPETMEDTWTALSSTDKFGVQADVDEDGVLDTDSDGNPLDADGNILDMTAFDFSSIPSGITYVKAVYTPGEWLDSGSSFYSANKSVSYSVVGDVSDTSTNIGISFQYIRVNEFGYGAARMREPKIKMDLTQLGASGSTSMSIDVDNSEIIPVELTPSQQVSSISYELRDIFNSNIIAGAQKSSGDALGTFYLEPTDDDDGFLFKGLSNYLLELAYENLDDPTGTSWVSYTLLKLIPLYRTTTGSSYTNATFAKKAREPLCNLVSEYIASTGVDGVPEGITWYQLQYAVLQTSSPYYVSDDVAKAYVESYPKLTR